MALSCRKKLSALFCKMTSKRDRDFYCLNCLHSFGTKNKQKSMKIYVKIMIIAI